MQIHFKNYQKKDRLLDLTQPQIMGILNFTPDSFPIPVSFLAWIKRYSKWKKC